MNKVSFLKLPCDTFNDLVYDDNVFHFHIFPLQHILKVRFSTADGYVTNLTIVMEIMNIPLCGMIPK